jgi:hypothetical protein
MGSIGIKHQMDTFNVNYLSIPRVSNSFAMFADKFVV